MSFAERMKHCPTCTCRSHDTEAPPHKTKDPPHKLERTMNYRPEKKADLGSLFDEMIGKRDPKVTTPQRNGDAFFSDFRAGDDD